MISVSYLSGIDQIDSVMDRISQTDCDYLHVDVMDGIFVPNKTLEYDLIKGKLIINKDKDVHLMVKDVKKYIDLYKELKPVYFTFHYEAVNNIGEIIDYIKSLNIKVGISIKPNTSVECLIPYLKDIDLVLVMSVEPGYGGQSFMDSCLDKINQLYELRSTNNYNYKIEVDGGINIYNIEKCNKCDIKVVGSYITKSNNYQARIDKLRGKA